MEGRLKYMFCMESLIELGYFYLRLYNTIMIPSVRISYGKSMLYSHYFIENTLYYIL